MKLFAMLSCALLLGAITSACNQKRFAEDVEGVRNVHTILISYDRPWHLVADGGPDWKHLWDVDKYLMTYESLFPSEPQGVRVMAYGDRSQCEMFNLPAHGGQIDVAPGNYNLLLYNNDTEYILFNNLEASTLAMATTRSRSRSSYMGSPYVDRATNENTISVPDMLYARNGGELYSSAYNHVDTPLEIEMRPLVYKYLLRYHFEAGIQHVTLARGALAGMAASVFLSDGHTPTESATLLYEIEGSDFKTVTDAHLGAGFIQVVVNSFGAAGFPNEYYQGSRSEQTYGLNIELRLTNGNIKNFDFDITSQMRNQPRGGVIDVYGIVIKDEDAAIGESGSFGVDVDGWGNHQDIII